MNKPGAEHDKLPLQNMIFPLLQKEIYRIMQIEATNFKFGQQEAFDNDES